MLNTLFLKTNKLTLLLILASFCLYGVFAYNLARTDHTNLISIYIVLFGLFIKIVNNNKNNFKLLIAIAIISRLIFLIAIPNLSQDFYRFIWDGRMILQGFNPYLHTPASFIALGEYPISQAQQLVVGMQALNASHYSNYPPINQLLFTLANLFTSSSILGSVIGLRLIIIAADIGTLYFGAKLLKRLELSQYKIFWFILNPFIVIELTGNLHFEGVMLFFLILSLYLLHKNKWQWSAVIFALSISTKLVPLLFLPLFIKWFRVKDNHSKIDFKKLIYFYLIIGVSTLVLFTPFFSMEFTNNYSKTVGLWFGDFEFNASIYYIAREVGYLITGYNQIAIIGKILPVIIFTSIWYIALTRQNQNFITLIKSMLIAFTVYLLLSTTVHPWYIASILLLSIFTNYKYPLIWSFIIIISYLAYANADNTENLWIIGFEYLVVFTALFWDVLKQKKLLKY
ncbi:polyprenol phosphomannose-dependent alpha 1,6 mannosyltransferase MptB [Olleya marilimosa]|uniref:polyprenol phosphomannose-dependent alpha 1,6 mannosyltransferase MptB n=1 Tax=Olleya marilimosa TaxID=272164 RepID=UPI0030EE0724|tara:strand:- start:62737 stop:64101 length:1365 start_codon:yes stop_codon:yes gene_type:complete